MGNFEGHIFRSVDEPARREPFREVIKLVKRHRDFLRESEAADAIAGENKSSRNAPITSRDLAQLNSVPHESGAVGAALVRHPHGQSAASGSAGHPAPKLETRSSNDELEER